jgi:transposase InsO family protein
MRINALRARPRRRGKPKDDGERSVIADNILDQDFQTDRPNQNWLADFTYIWTAEGLTCHGIFPPPTIRVRPIERTDDEEGTTDGRADHWHLAGA